MKAVNMNRTKVCIFTRLAALGLIAVLAGTPVAVARDDGGVPGGFLRFGASARSLALGNAVSGTADDVATAYWNPSGLYQLRTMELTGMGATMFNDTRYSFFALGMPTETWGTFALNGTFTQSGEYERATWDQDLDETFSEKESIISLSWANGFDRFSYGVNFKTVNQSIGGASGNAMGMDAGLLYRPHRLFSLGLAAQNLIAPTITLVEDEEKLAPSYRAGLGLLFFKGRMTVTADLVKTEFMDTSFRGGMEVWPVKQIALRGGYDGEREHMSAGAGFRLENWQFDYAYVSTDLGGQNVVSATLRFGVPFGVKMTSDKALFSPSGTDSEVNFTIQTAVRSAVEAWHVEIRDGSGNVVKTLAGNGEPPGGISWDGEDDNGRLVGDGVYKASITILDHLGQEWEYDTNVEVMGFKDRTRVPIRVEISGNAPESSGGTDR